MAESEKVDDRDQVSALARSILKHIEVEGGNNIPLSTAACGSVTMYLLAISTIDENEQERFFLGLRNELLAFNKARTEGEAKSEK